MATFFLSTLFKLVLCTPPMAGIYIHIPFCHKACVYCDFHFTTSLRYKDRMIEALLLEIASRHEQTSEQIETIYFGGGTPSVLNSSDLGRILDLLNQKYQIESSAEVTLEANPEDSSLTTLNEWKSIGINRLSIGVQSFRDEDLIWMNRGHSAQQAIESIECAKREGFDNISVDLIFGLPKFDIKHWISNLNQLLDLNVNHVSLYALTVEPKTALAHQVKKRLTEVAVDSEAAEQFMMARKMLMKKGYLHYEISNYAKPGWESKHNSSYWKDVNYLGFGPSAHSFNGQKRRWNVSNNQRYMKAVEADEKFWESETLSPTDRFNEYILTRLRTSWGCDLSYIANEFGVDLSGEQELVKHLEAGTVVIENNSLRLAEKGLLLADGIASDLFRGI